MGKRRGGTRKACVLVAVMAACLRGGIGPHRYGAPVHHVGPTSRGSVWARLLFRRGSAAGIALSGAVDSPDVDFDGIPDDEDILAAALSYIGTRPHYKSAYYASGYPDDEFGVCTDVVAIACRDAGYDLQRLVAATSSTVRTPTASPPRIRRSIFAAPRTSRCSWCPCPESYQ